MASVRYEKYIHIFCYVYVYNETGKQASKQATTSSQSDNNCVKDRYELL